jgi:hypothetical protein
MVVNAVLENLKRTHDAFVQRSIDRACCETSWNKQARLAQEVDGITFTDEDAKHRDQALAGYDLELKELQLEAEKWQQALGHALDSLEGRV